MIAKVHEATKPDVPSGSGHGELFIGLLGLLNGNGSSYNAADAGANQEMAEIFRWRKKAKRKKVMKL